MDSLIGTDTQSVSASGAQNAEVPAQVVAKKPEETAEFWKARYDGANRKLSEFSEALKSKEMDYKSTTTSLVEKLTAKEQAEKSLSEQLGNLQKERDDFSSKFAEADKRAATLTDARKRDRIIADNFPGLTQYQAKGLLKEEGFGSDDDYIKYLDSFNQTLTGVKKAAILNDLMGTVPPATPTKDAGVPNKEMLYEQHAQAMKSKDWKLAQQIEGQLATAK